MTLKTSNLQESNAIMNRPPAPTSRSLPQSGDTTETGLIVRTSEQLDFLPAPIRAAGEQASMRFMEFFAANIRNPNTRQAYAHAVKDFFAWCDHHGITLARLQPILVAAYIEQIRGQVTASMKTGDR